MFLRKAKNRELKRWHLYVLGIIALTAIGYRIYSALWPTATVHIDGQIIKVQVADTYPRRLQGLSNRDSLGRWGGMLFVFPERAEQTMVMRDMRFALDMIWIDGNTIVDMAPNLRPEPGRTEEQLTKYFARRPATLVLELPAGFIVNSRLRIGDLIEVVN